MFTEFASVEEAKNHALTLMGINSLNSSVKEELIFKETAILNCLLGDPEISEDTRKLIQDKLSNKKFFSIESSRGLIMLAIEPFNNGFNCMIFNENGIAVEV